MGRRGDEGRGTHLTFGVTKLVFILLGASAIQSAFQKCKDYFPVSLRSLAGPGTVYILMVSQNESALIFRCVLASPQFYNMSLCSYENIVTPSCQVTQYTCPLPKPPKY